MDDGGKSVQDGRQHMTSMYDDRFSESTSKPPNCFDLRFRQGPPVATFRIMKPI